MKKIVVLTLSLILFATLALSVPVVFAGSNNANGLNGFQGTNKESNQLPPQSSVPWPAGLVELIFGPPGTPTVVEGCRAGGEDELIHVGGVLGNVLGAKCCASNMIDAGSGLPFPNQCCNPPDLLYPQALYTPGNHCLCFVMRFP